MRLPRTRRGRLMGLAGGVLVVIVAGFAFIYFVLFPTSSPAPLSLTTASSTSTAAAAAAATPDASGTSYTGQWTIGPGSIAGYRVREKLAFLPAESDAVGRTSEITGTATLTQSGHVVTVKAASFVVDVETLKSNESMRDEHIQTIGIQSATYPKATFVLSTPLVLPSTAVNGGIFATRVTGVFNIHGTARRLTVPLQMRLTGSEVQAVGSLTFPWGEFDMTAPSVGGFVSVTSHATMEFELILKRA